MSQITFIAADGAILDLMPFLHQQLTS